MVTSAKYVHNQLWHTFKVITVTVSCYNASTCITLINTHSF